MADDKGQPWQKLHDKYATFNWKDKPNIFAEEALAYLPSGGRLLDIGAGRGQDSKFFADNGFDVTSLDITTAALAEINDSRLKVVKADISAGLPFEAGSFDVVYAHLSLHYFDEVNTKNIFADIARVLKPGGVLSFFTNSTSDPEYDTGKKLEDDYFFIEDKAKRFFSVETARKFSSPHFDEILADNKGETYKDSNIGVHNLIRYIGKKRSESK